MAGHVGQPTVRLIYRLDRKVGEPGSGLEEKCIDTILGTRSVWQLGSSANSRCDHHARWRKRNESTIYGLGLGSPCCHVIEVRVLVHPWRKYRTGAQSRSSTITQRLAGYPLGWKKLEDEGLGVRADATYAGISRASRIPECIRRTGRPSRHGGSVKR